MIWEDRWPSRAQLACRYIRPGSSVIDLGAGAEGLRRFLPRGCDYTPADLPDFDMNAGLWPDGRWDVAVMLGVIERSTDPADTLRHVRAIAPRAIVTYAHLGLRGPGWNAISPRAFKRLAREAGWQATPVDTWRYRRLVQRVYELR
jgi:hypothetical protein